MHNQVNKRLHKELFDCSKIGDFYDCGCAEDEKAAQKPEMEESRKEKLTGANGRDLDTDILAKEG